MNTISKKELIRKFSKRFFALFKPRQLALILQKNLSVLGKLSILSFKIIPSIFNL